MSTCEKVKSTGAANKGRSLTAGESMSSVSAKTTAASGHGWFLSDPLALEGV